MNTTTIISIIINTAITALAYYAGYRRGNKNGLYAGRAMKNINNNFEKAIEIVSGKQIHFDITDLTELQVEQLAELYEGFVHSNQSEKGSNV